jgi:uncharacterized protein HemX
MMWSNFLFRVRQWAWENRARLIRFALILAAILLAVLLIFAAVEKIQSWQYEKRVQALEKQRRDAEDRAAAAEARKAELEKEMAAETARGEELKKQAKTLDAALKAAQGKTKILKETYETVRYVPIDPATPVSVESACRELAAIGYECK